MLRHIVLFQRRPEVAPDANREQALVADLKPCYEWAAVDYTV